MELRVKDVCKEKNILFKELAEKLNISDVALRKQVQGNPTIETLEKIASALDVPITELFEQPQKNTLTLNCPHCGKPIELQVK